MCNDVIGVDLYTEYSLEELEDYREEMIDELSSNIYPEDEDGIYLEEDEHYEELDFND